MFGLPGGVLSTPDEWGAVVIAGLIAGLFYLYLEAPDTEVTDHPSRWTVTIGVLTLVVLYLIAETATDFV